MTQWRALSAEAGFSRYDDVEGGVVLESMEAATRRLYVLDDDEPHVVEVPELSFLMVDGQGDPAGEAYAQTVKLLMQVAAVTWRLVGHTIDAPLEGLWSGDLADRSTWRWTSMVLQPSEVSNETLAEAAALFGSGPEFGRVADLRLERFAEGQAAQVLHRGPHAEEGPTIERLHTFLGDQGFAMRGRHHEIYLTNVFEVAPADSLTVLRQPVAPA
jgi:hypothetical protein